MLYFGQKKVFIKQYDPFVTKLVAFNTRGRPSLDERGGEIFFSKLAISDMGVREVTQNLVSDEKVKCFNGPDDFFMMLFVLLTKWY